MIRFFLILLLCLSAQAGPVVFPGYDAQVMDWNNRASTNNGGFSGSQNASIKPSTRLAATEFMRAIRNAGFYPSSTNVGKIMRLNLFAGNDFHNGNSDTCLGAVQTPLISDFGNSLDTTPQAQATFSYAEQGSTGGLSGNGAAQLQTGLVASNTLSSVSNASFGIYVTVPGLASSTWSMGGQDPSGTGWGLAGPDFSGVGTRGDCFIVGTAVSDSGGKGFYCVSRQTNTDLYKNGVIFGSVSGTTGHLTVQDVWVLCLNLNGFRSSASSKTFGGYCIGTTLTSAQQLVLYNTFQRFETCLRRQQ